MHQRDLKDVSPEFVRAVNLAYHEEEAAEYDSRHPEIMTDELGHWSRVAERISLLKASLGRPIKIVDLGSGPLCSVTISVRSTMTTKLSD
jgi:hypothetical protein